MNYVHLVNYETQPTGWEGKNVNRSSGLMDKLLSLWGQVKKATTSMGLKHVALDWNYLSLAAKVHCFLVIKILKNREQKSKEYLW